jgi:hypothetical protein
MIRNIHQRQCAASAEAAGALLDSLAGPHDRLWPGDAWPPMQLDRGLAVGSRGGHGPIRYSVESYQPGRSVVFRFLPGVGIDGVHRFEVLNDGESKATLRHEIDGIAVGSMRIMWPLLVRPLHDALVEDALDNATAALGNGPAPVRRHSVAVRIGRRVMAPKATPRGLERVAGNAATAGLAIASSLHLAWGLGSPWPMEDATSLARAVVGGAVFPSRVACLGVASLLAVAAALVAARAHPRSRLGRWLPLPVTDPLVVGIAGVLALRGVGGFLASASTAFTTAFATTAQFRSLNLRLYSPLCIALAVGSYAATGRLRELLRTRGPAVNRSTVPATIDSGTIVPS